MINKPTKKKKKINLKKKKKKNSASYSKELIRSLKLKTTQSAFAATASRSWTPA